MHINTPYTKEEIVSALHNVISLARDQADMNKMHGFETADDFIAEKSITIVEYVKDMITHTPEYATDISK